MVSKKKNPTTKKAPAKTPAKKVEKHDHKPPAVQEQSEIQDEQPHFDEEDEYEQFPEEEQEEDWTPVVKTVKKPNKPTTEEEAPVVEENTTKTNNIKKYKDEEYVPPKGKKSKPRRTRQPLEDPLNKETDAYDEATQMKGRSTQKKLQIKYMDELTEDHVLRILSASLADCDDRTIGATFDELLKYFSSYDPYGQEYISYTGIKIQEVIANHPKIFDIDEDRVWLMHELRAPNPHVFDDLYDSRNPQISNKHSDVAKDRFRTTFSKVDASSFGFRPETAEQSLKFIAKLGEYEVPEHLTRLTELARIGTQEDYDNELHRVVTAEFNLNTATDLINSCTHTKRYKSVFQMLLYLEELQMKIDIRTYDLFDIKLEIDFHRRELFRITVPGLAEGRPSVMQGDQIFVVDKESNEVHQGYAHVCAMDHVLCSFSDQVSDKKIYDVQFTFTRSTLRAMHRALENGFLFDMLIDRETWGHRLRVDKKELQNKVEGMDLADKRLNKKQAQLVELLAHRRMSLPIVLFGPPGTGKTSSLVEAIHQLLIKDPEARILICTPSNSSADLICVRLHRLSAIARDSMLRLNAFARKLSSIADEEIKPYCVLDEKDQFTFPMLSVLREKRVIITTLMSSSYLYSFGLSKHFTHIVIDECGQSMEPETIVPLLTSNSDAVILFAGDPRQLGPIIRSPMAIQCGMDISLLERITELHEKESPCCHLIRLHETYRSHPSIMNLYSKTFYEGSLVCRSDKSITHSLLSWKGFKRNKHTHPILFKHTSGLESRTADSPSWFNDDEAEVVMDTALSLLTQKLNLTVEDIGIITPYRKQVEKIRAKINSNPATRGIQIGTVEVYQGKEKRAIIISTVRSQQKYITFDDKFKLGFLKNPKRLNVAISRAQAALVIVGNAQLLCLDENWKKVIDACVHLNCYDGPKIVPLVVNEHDLVENQEVMNPDQEWRGDAL